MQIVIDIEEGLYKQIMKDDSIYVIGDVDMMLIENAIYNGIPLPKGHGRIIDERKIKTVYTQTEEVFCGTLKTERTYILYTDAPTIIEDERKGAES